jgi:hypothetical protein
MEIDHPHKNVNESKSPTQVRPSAKNEEIDSNLETYPRQFVENRTIHKRKGETLRSILNLYSYYYVPIFTIYQYKCTYTLETFPLFPLQWCLTQRLKFLMKRSMHVPLEEFYLV